MNDVAIETVMAVEALRMVPYKFGWDLGGYGGYARTRNVMATRFLKMGLAPYFIVVDRDIVFNADAIAQLLDDLKNGCDLVGGCYVVKDGKSLATCAGGTGKIPIESGLVDVRWLSTGFGAFSAKLLDKMVKELDLPLMHKGDPMEAYPFFEDHAIQADNGEWMWASEDYDFSDKARSVGITPYLDVRVWADHVGKKRWKVDECLLKEPVSSTEL